MPHQYSDYEYLVNGCRSGWWSTATLDKGWPLLIDTFWQHHRHWRGIWRVKEWKEKV